MRILFVGNEEQYSRMKTGSAPQGERSFFFEADFPALGEVGRWDLVVAPAAMVLARPQEFYAAPLIAYGPERLLDLCLGSGCADYMREPWTQDELLARAELRSLSALQLDASGLSVRYGMLCGTLGRVPLSATASAALALLAANRPRAVPREALAAVMETKASSSRALDMAMSRLRSALRACGGARAASRLVALRATAARRGAYCLLE
ncbi:MAG TPA: hypothetical protein DCG47_12375 [Spirochaetaceae bacterium]|jgi:hypothetical protein|nr:hypothetical protein [Spirochaetaceae bacterium]